MTHTNDWVIYTRDRELRRYSEVDEYTKFEASLKFNDVGRWTLELHRDSPALIPLTTPGFGIIVVNKTTHETLFSGYIDEREQNFNEDAESLIVSGWDDNVILSWRVSVPDPLDPSPPYNAKEFDERSGLASTVMRDYVNLNVGPFAIGPRRWPNFEVAEDPFIGKSIKGKLRWGNLLEDLRSLALQGGGLGFRCVQVNQTIQFQIYEPEDKTQEVKFSVPLSSIIGGKIKSKSPEATYVYVGGEGEGTARTIREGKNDGQYDTWGRREVFEDSSGTSDADELQQKIDEVLETKGEQAEFELEIQDTEGLHFGVDYNLGDKVTAILVGRDSTDDLTPPGTPLVGPMYEGGAVTELIREIQLTITSNEMKLKPIMGTPGKQHIFRLFREIRRIKQRLLNLESK